MEYTKLMWVTLNIKFFYISKHLYISGSLGFYFEMTLKCHVAMQPNFESQGHVFHISTAYIIEQN